MRLKRQSLERYVTTVSVPPDDNGSDCYSCTDEFITIQNPPYAPIAVPAGCHIDEAWLPSYLRTGPQEAPLGAALPVGKCSPAKQSVFS
jgi:hypothetical protein